MPDLTQIIQTKLNAAFTDAALDFRDYKHDGVHFVLEITSSRFKGLSLVQQHRLVYDVLGDLLQSGELHALKLKTIAK